jgi:hypothetical protein
MLALGLALALQITVQADVDSGRVSGGITVRAPVYKREVTEALRRSAFRDAPARELLLKARAARLEQDSALQSYDVKSYQRISVGMSIRANARDRLAFRTESAARVRWQRGIGAHVELLGARSAAPIVAGIRDAERDIEQDMSDELHDMFAVPYFPGKDELWLFEMIGNSDDGDPETDRGPMLIHPIAEGAEAYFTFATGDSVLMVLPDGKQLRLREIIATPREPAWNLVVASMWFETEEAHLVRAVMRFSAPMNIWETVEQEDPNARDDMPRPVRAFLSPMTAEMTAVTIEYGLYEQRFWLPRTQGAEGHVRVSFMRVPMRIEQRYRYESVNALPPMPPIVIPARIRSDSIRAMLYAQGLDSAAVRDSIRHLYTRADTLRRAARAAQCEADSTYVEYSRQEDGRLPLALRVPCDRRRLANSPELPPSIYDSGEELFGAADREELMRSLDFGLQPAWAPRPPTVEYGLTYTRFNRIEGFATGVNVSSALGRGYTVGLLPRLSLADLQLNGDLTISRSNGRRILKGALYRRLDVSSDFGDPLSFGASIPNFFYARDEGFYHRSWGAELATESNPRGGLEWRAFAEQQWSATVENEWSLFGGAHDDRYLGNLTADAGWYYGTGVRWRGSRGLDPRGWRGSADIRLEGATGEKEYGRYFLETNLSRGIGPVAASLTAAGGSSSGELPAQRQFFLGGLHSVRGQTAGTATGNAFWLGRLEIGTNVVAARPVIFGDVGWAGSRVNWREAGRPLAGVGAGASFLDGMFRFDVSRGVHPRWQTRVDFYLEARF